MPLGYGLYHTAFRGRFKLKKVLEVLSMLKEDLADRSDRGVEAMHEKTFDLAVDLLHTSEELIKQISSTLAQVQKSKKTGAKYISNLEEDL